MSTIRSDSTFLPPARRRKIVGLTQSIIDLGRDLEENARELDRIDAEGREALAATAEEDRRRIARRGRGR